MWFLNIWGENTRGPQIHEIDTPDFIFSKHYFDNMQPSDTIYDTWKHPYHGGIHFQNFTFSIFHWFQKISNFMFCWGEKKNRGGFVTENFNFFNIFIIFLRISIFCYAVILVHFLYQFYEEIIFGNLKKRENRGEIIEIILCP